MSSNQTTTITGTEFSTAENFVPEVVVDNVAAEDTIINDTETEIPTLAPDDDVEDAVNGIPTLQHDDTMSREAGDEIPSPAHDDSDAEIHVVPEVMTETQISTPAHAEPDTTIITKDSFDMESGTVHGHTSKSGAWTSILKLAFQSMGVVYGDLGTSVMYVYSTTFTGGIKHNDDILGALSLIFYTVTLIALVKYVFIVLRANNNGDGGTLAMYSLICRHAKVALIASEEALDQDVSALELPDNRARRAARLKSTLENSVFAKIFLLLATMLGTSMFIGDGILSPCLSVLSAVGGIRAATTSMTEGRIVWISVAILVGMFMFQRLGTHKVGYSFAPIICLWFTLIAGIGMYNFVKYDPTVVKAINPQHIVAYFGRNKKEAWISLSGVVLAITGAEALFADVGHFSVRSIQISMCTVTYPALVLAYAGQASFLRKHSDVVSDTFFKSIPSPIYWPMFVVAVLASVVASQSMITGTFSIVQQSISLGCFPRVKVVQTSSKYEGQIFIPVINYLMMLACIAITLGFRTTEKISNAYGIAVVFVMALTSCFLVIIMIVIWRSNIVLVILYLLVIGLVELVYLSSVFYRFDQGGYLTFAFAVVIMLVMLGVWWCGGKRERRDKGEDRLGAGRSEATN